MTDWHKYNNAKRISEAKRAAAYDSARASGRRLDDLQQRHLVQLLREHPEHTYYKSLIEQVDIGRTLTSKQAGVARRIADEKSWPVRGVR